MGKVVSGVGSHECLGAFAPDDTEGIRVFVVTMLGQDESQPQHSRRGLRALSPFAGPVCLGADVGHSRDARKGLLEHLQPFALDFRAGVIRESRNVTARPGQAGHELRLDRRTRVHHDDRHRGRCPHRILDQLVDWHHDHINLAAHQFRHDFGASFGFALR